MLPSALLLLRRLRQHGRGAVAEDVGRSRKSNHLFTTCLRCLFAGRGLLDCTTPCAHFENDAGIRFH